MSHRKRDARPWYCADSLTDDYIDVGRSGGDLRMIKQIKAVQSLIANIGVIILGVVAIFYASADATVVATTGIVTLGLLNGVLAVDYAAVAQALLELSDPASTDDDQQ